MAKLINKLLVIALIFNITSFTISITVFGIDIINQAEVNSQTKDSNGDNNKVIIKDILNAKNSFNPIQAEKIEKLVFLPRTGGAKHDYTLVSLFITIINFALLKYEYKNNKNRL
jgi:hypothetical protein